MYDWISITILEFNYLICWRYWQQNLLFNWPGRLFRPLVVIESTRLDDCQSRREVFEITPDRLIHTVFISLTGRDIQNSGDRMWSTRDAMILLAAILWCA